MTKGTPKRAIHPDRSVRATVSAVMLAMGKASGQRVKRSTQVSMYEYPLDGGRGPVISMWMCENRSSGVGNSPVGARVCLFIFDF